MVRTFKRAVVRLHRQTMNELGMRGAYREDGSEAVYSAECILALGLRELEFAQQWPKAVRFVGPVRYTPPNLGEPPMFVAGRRHVLVSLGTHLHAHKDRIARAVEAAARALPEVEFHFTDGRVAGAGAGGGATRTVGSSLANFQRLPFIDYGLLPRYDLVVHHAGAGILNETIAAGLPAIVLPIDYDQFDNAARLRAAGLAVGVRSLTDLPLAVARAFAEADRDDAAKAIRQRYRDLVASQPGEELISALVRSRI
jgi:UDP:flavonoid glycosyltransferase YjiC (YdhE family)